MTAHPLLEVAEVLSSAFDDGVDGVAEWHALLQREFSSGRADSECSSVVLSEGRVVAACLVNRHETLGRIGPTGVVPNWRRRRIGVSLVSYCLQRLTEHGVSQAVLEVDHSNHAALALYGQVGFARGRTLHVLRGNGLPSFRGGDDVATIPMAAANALAKGKAFHGHRPAYQRRPFYTLTLGASLSAVGALRAGELVGVLIWSGRDIVDISATDGDREVVAKMLQVAFEQSPSFRMINVADDDPVAPVLTSLGFGIENTAVEMEKKL